MSTILNEWNLLADRFNTHKVDDEVHPDASVNIYVGWPAFLQQVEFQAGYLGKKHLDILDYGCGAGKFLLRLKQDGHKVVGMDRSERMLEIAQEKTAGKIELLNYDHYLRELNDGKLDSKFDLITSMHVFDWIEDIEEVLVNAARMLRPGGEILFSVFPKKHIVDSLRIHDLFEDFDSVENPYLGFANFDGVRVPVFVREACFYDSFFSNIGFEKVLEFYPPYSKSFLKKSKWSASLCPEMLILSYRKLEES